MSRLQIDRLGYALGAQVTGLDLRAPLDDFCVAEIRQAWLDHLLLCFPEQNLSARELEIFARRFGDLEEQNLSKHAETPSISVLSNRPASGAKRTYKNGSEWHSDKSFTLRPTAATFIACKEIPQVGGDTIFANMYSAYEALSPGMKTIVNGLHAIHDVPVRRQSHSGGAPAIQPVARIHPETRRRALFLGYRARRIEGMTEGESFSLLQFLNEHAVKYEFSYRHRWKDDDLLMWDNRSTLHIALTDYDLSRDVRHMYLTAMVGSDSGRHAQTEADASPTIAVQS